MEPNVVDPCAVREYHTVVAFTLAVSILDSMDRLSRLHPYLLEGLLVAVSVTEQRLWLLDSSRQAEVSYPVSTARKGTGSKVDSFQTPLGLHRICKKIGHDAPSGTVFKGRIPTGECAPPVTDPDKADIEEDRITSRILWLEGLEPGINRGPDIDTMKRYIYIHGTPQEILVGQPCSHGCIRMKNKDIIDLFDRVSEGTPVIIAV